MYHIVIAKNRCCKHKWKDQPGAFATVLTDGRACCPECGSVYWKWTNYNILFKKYNWKNIDV